MPDKRVAVSEVGSWFRKNLGDAMMAFEQIEQIESQFRSIYGRRACADDVAVFTRHNSEGSLHCRVEVFVSPAAGELAKQIDAEPCRKPPTNDLGLLAGNPACWSVLFPEWQR